MSPSLRHMTSIAVLPGCPRTDNQLRLCATSEIAQDLAVRALKGPLSVEKVALGLAALLSLSQFVDDCPETHLPDKYSTLEAFDHCLRENQMQTAVLRRMCFAALRTLMWINGQDKQALHARELLEAALTGSAPRPHINDSHSDIYLVYRMTEGCDHSDALKRVRSKIAFQQYTIPRVNHHARIRREG